jgi:Flp pilus assembly protein TadB
MVMSNDNPPADDVFVDADADATPLEEHLKSRATWTRLLFMVICYVLVSIASFVGTFIVVLGFLWVLFTGEVNRQIQQVGQSLAAYISEIIRYLTFNTEERPFPLGNEWPSGKTE